ncbi:MAG: hypothetical protein J6R67_06000 [Treponema sp.]|nr:hypothetical protein [Treponema sp.]
MSILTAEYDFDTAMAVRQEEAYAEGVSFGLLTGREEGISIGLERGIERGLVRGAYETKLETAKKLIAMGLSFEQAAEGTGLAIETIQQVVDTM